MGSPAPPFEGVEKAQKARCFGTGLFCFAKRWQKSCRHDQVSALLAASFGLIVDPAMLSSSVNACVNKGCASDAEALALLFADAWRQAYRGIIPHSHLELIIDRRGPRWWRNAVRSKDAIIKLTVGEEIAGYASFGSDRARGSERGEIYELYISPTHQGLGFGEYLFESCRHELDLLKYRGLVIWALADNTMATDLYWRRGGRPFAEVEDKVGGRRVSKIGFVWP